MKPCRKQNQGLRQPPGPVHQTAAPSASDPPRVHRYVHPIRTARPASRSPEEELLTGVLEALSRQSDKLDEVLRRLGCDNSDTI